jgi:hypothetical protein
VAKGRVAQAFNLAVTIAKMRFRRYNVLTNHTYPPPDAPDFDGYTTPLMTKQVEEFKCNLR